MLDNITYKNILKLTMPIILGLVAQNIINVTDTIFLGHLSEIALGAGAIGGLFYFLFVILGSGLGTGVQIIIGRRNGENNTDGIKSVFSNGLYLALFISTLLLILLFYYAHYFLNIIVASKSILTETQNYINFRKWGLLIAYANIILRSFFIGTLKTKVLIYSTLFMSAVNIFFDYALIFGNFGLPQMGVSGAALASVIAETSDMLFLTAWVLFSKPLRHYKIFKFSKPNLQLIANIFKVSYPVMLQYFFSFGGWFIFFLIIEKMGETELAVSNIIRSFYMVIMIPVWGLSSATNSMVSNLIGSNRINKVSLLIRKMVLMSLGSTVIIVLMYIFIPELVIGLYTKNTHLISASVPVLHVISVTVLFFSVSYVVFSAVSGTGNTLYAFFIEAFTIVIYVAGTYFVGVVLKQSLPLVWMVELMYFIVLGILSYIYFLKFKWKDVKI